MKTTATASPPSSAHFLCSFSAILLFICGCSEKSSPKPTGSEPVLSQQYRQGSATVIVSVSETNIATSGNVQLTLDVQAPLGANVVFPEIGNLIGSFGISDRYTEPLQTLPNGKILHRRIWRLVPDLPDKAVFLPLEIAAGTATIQTEAIAVSVRSILPEGLDTFEIRDIAAPAILLPGQGKVRRQWIVFLGLATAMALVALGIGLARRPKRKIVLSPHEQAFQALEDLPGEPLEKIHRLSEILMAFIGGRFGLPTLGKTIHEVVPLLPKKVLLGRRHKLEKFLFAAEEIRFSNRVPQGFPEDYEQYARGFVEATKQEEPCD